MRKNDPYSRASEAAMPRSHRIFSVPSVLPSSIPPSSDHYRKRMKQSVLDLLAFPDASDHNNSREQRGRSFLDRRSFLDKEYKNISSSKERVEKALWMFKRDVLTPYEDDPEAADNLKEEVKKFMEEQVDKGLTQEEANELKIEAIINLVKEKKEIDTFKVLRVFGKTVISYADIVTDVLVLFEFMVKNQTMAIIQGLSLGLSMLVQCLGSLVFGQPIWVGLLGLVGMKPLLEAWRDAVQAKPFPKQKMGNDFMRMFSRVVEIVFEAIPQSLIQSVALLLYPDQRSYLQFFSLLASFLTTGFMVATADRDIDTNKKTRRNESTLYGYARINCYPQIVSSIVCFTCYKAAKMFSLALLIASAHPKYTIGLLAIECFVFFLWRRAYRNWRSYVRGADGRMLSFLMHFGLYFSLLSAPFPVIRLPHLFTPRIYAGVFIYMCFINFAIVFATYRVFDARDVLPESYSWIGLSAVTSLTVVSGAIAFSYVPETHKKALYKHRTLKEHLSTYNWNEKELEFDARNREVKDQDGIRALMVLWISPHYLPKEKLMELYKEKWAGWCADPPYWFDKEFKALVPRELLVGVDKKLWGEEAKLSYTNT